MALITSSWPTDLLTLFAGLLTVLYFYFTFTYDYWKKRNIPFEKPSLLFGNFYNAVTFKQNITSYFEDQYKKTDGKFFGLYIFRRPYLLIRDPELVKIVLVKDFNNFIPRTTSPTHEDDKLGQYSIFSMKNVHDWRFLRSKISPIFSTGKLRNMFGLVDDIGKKLNEHLENEVNKTIEIESLCRRYTADVITSTIFGFESNSFSKVESEFLKTIKEVFTFTFRRGIELMFFFFVPTLAKLLRLKVFGETGTEFFRNIFRSAVKIRKENNIQRPDLIDALITLKETGSIEDIPEGNGANKNVVSHNSAKDEKSTLKFDGDVLVAQIAVFFAAGFGTSSSAMSFTIYFLSYHPEVQIKLRKEIQSVIAKHGGNITYDDILEMKYLDLCVKETLRLCPTLGYLDRESMSEYTFPGTNVTIDKGTPVIISLSGLQRDPQYFENPDVYDPERFSDENKHKFPPFTYLPFGDGPRNCIGARLGLMMTKMGLIHILKDFEVATFKSPPPLELDPRGFFLAIKNGMNLKFVPGTVYVK